MKIGPLSRIALLLCLGMTPLMASAMRTDLRAYPLDRQASARRQGPRKVHQATGEVLAASAGSLLVLHARGWKKQKMAFTLTAQTDKTVSLGKGERIVVFYQEIGGRRIAVRILPAPPVKRAQGAAKLHEATGELLTMSAGGLVLLHARGRGKQRMAFDLTASTVKPAGLRRGERIVVFYQEMGGRRIATRIRPASPARHAHRGRTIHSPS